ncbi:hypothetical protein GALMADRAFT_212537 [Galerina marginata CBS 339.88]|uniref:Uncharacterized protein n=1 Tax=Galerina marginata (strain CBS 339.88) TaxID=685588 RepID=A0A067T196_GALM3|nr:hypothetical protein GALMADRAFT_212537 [Galerina marginata CBS 339.88]
MSTAPQRWVVVDDMDLNIQYSGDGRDWVLDQGSRDDVGNFGPSYKSTLHGTTMPVSLILSLVYGPNNPRNDSGVIDPTWECFVDNVRVPPTAPFQFSENNQEFCDQDHLYDGPHVITVNATVMRAQTFWFDSFRYVPSPSLALDQAAVLLDSFNPLLQYGPGWGTLGDGANQTGQTNTIANMDFVGVSVSWYGLIPTEFAHAATMASYAIDRGGPTSFVLRGLSADSSPTNYNQKFFETPTLTAGHHQLVVTYHGTSQTTPLTLDYLIIQNGTITSSNTTTPGTSPSGNSHGSDPVKKSSNTAAIVGVLIAIAAYLYLRRREKKLNEGAHVGEPASGFIEPFHYIPVSSSVAQFQNTEPPAPVALSYQGRSPEFSTSNTRHSSRREGEAIANILRSQMSQPTLSPSFAENSSPRVMMHEDSGFRIPTGGPASIVEVPPMYTPG